MKVVLLKSIRGLGQQAGKLNLKIALYFCRLDLKCIRSLSGRQDKKNFNR